MQRDNQRQRAAPIKHVCICMGVYHIARHSELPRCIAKDSIQIVFFAYVARQNGEYEANKFSFGTKTFMQPERAAVLLICEKFNYEVVKLFKFIH